MLEIKEQENSPVEENNPPEVNKYHKRIDDLIEDAEIEAEIEAEKNIRSKNSRMFSISMIGICLLGLVYFQINYQAALSPVEPEAPIQKPETPEESLAKQVPVVEDGSIASNLPIAPTASPGKVKKEINPFVAPPKPKSIIPPAKTNKVKKPAKIKKTSQTPKPKPSPIKTPAVKLNEDSRFFIQAGAFSVKKNAELYLKHLQAKGFAPSIQTRSNIKKQHIVTVGSFANAKAGDKKLRELASKGFNASTYKNSKNSFSLKVGQFINLKEARSLQDKLSVKGFLSESRTANEPAKTYIVQLGVFPNREKALLVKEKLARAGYPKTFLR